MGLVTIILRGIFKIAKVLELKRNINVHVRVCVCVYMYIGFPGGVSGKEPLATTRDIET